MNFEKLSQLTIGVAGFMERVDGQAVKETDWTDVARALGNASPESRDLLRGLYLHDERATRRVFARLAEAYTLAGVPKKLAKEAARVTFGAFLAMRPCEHCEGTGLVKMPRGMRLDIETGEWTAFEGGWKPCGWCKGDGHTHVYPTVARDALHVSMQVWEGLLAEPYDAAYSMLRRWHNNGVSAIIQTR